MASPQPPGPRAPRLVQAVRFVRSQPELLQRTQATYGDVFQLNFQRHRWNVMCHPDAIKQVFTAPSDVLHAGEGNEILETSLGSHSVLLLDEAEHMRHRKLLLPSFHGEKLAKQMLTIEEIAEREVQKIPRGKPFAVRQHSQEIALEVILEVVLGTASSGEEHDRLAAGTLGILDWIGRPSILLMSAILGPRHTAVKRVYKGVLEPLDAALYRLIRERRTAEDLESRDDILSMLLLARDDDGTPMTDAEIRDEIVTLIVAGHETTATALAWAFERLTRLPDGAERLHAEALTDETEYTRAVAHEALRLRPVLDFVVRRVAKPVEIAGYSFEPGETITPCIHLVHLRPDIYPDPHAFKPERWIGQKPGTYTWIPFGGGVRRCIGFSFAMAEFEIVLRAVARAGVLQPVGEPEPVVQRFITSSPARGGEVMFAS